MVYYGPFRGFIDHWSFLRRRRIQLIPRVFASRRVCEVWVLTITGGLTSIPRFFQLPIFFLAARALYTGPPKLQSYWPIMLAYSASSCTTTFGRLAILWTSTDPTIFQMALLPESCIPFFLVPFGMAIDMTVRLTGKAQRIRTLRRSDLQGDNLN